MFKLFYLLLFRDLFRTPVKCGDKIRLQHLATKRNLHSHLFQSPITHNQEVSAFGEGGDGDEGIYIINVFFIVCKL